MFWFDWTMIIVLPAFILGVIVQAYLSRCYSKYKKVESVTGLTGYTAARKILDAAGLYSVQIECIGGELTDHFDPRSNVLRLSKATYYSKSVASIGVAAHECGHAIQYAENYTPMQVRGALVKSVNFSSTFSFLIVLLGLFIRNSTVAMFGVGLYFLVVLFQLVTLPVEFNASRRAVKILESSFLPANEMVGVKSVLRAAALTYVAALASALLQLLRLFIIAGGGRDDR